MTDGDRRHLDGCTRREACRTAARWLALTGIIGGGAALALRSAASNTVGCGQTLACGDCRAIARCALPQAAAARRKAKG